MLHIALRAPRDAVIEVDGHDVVPDVHEVLDRMGDLAEPGALGGVDRRDRRAHPPRRQHRDRRLGPGPRDGRTAPWPTSPTRRSRSTSCRTSTATTSATRSTGIDPAATLVIVSSKTFTTLETLTNARTARRLDRGRAGRGRGAAALRRRLDQRRGRSPAFGIDTANMVGFWDWVGGRYSVDSAIGLSLDDRDRRPSASASSSTASG